MTTWAQVIKTDIIKQTQPLKIQNKAFNIKLNDKTKSIHKSNIPTYVRFEKEIASDDDMIIHHNINDTNTMNDIYLFVIPNKQFIFNHFHKGKRNLFHYTIL